MDLELQKKLEEYGAGFDKVLQEKFLANEASRKGKSIQGETNDLFDQDDIDSILHCVIDRNPAETDYFWEFLAACKEDELRKLLTGEAVSTKKDKGKSIEGETNDLLYIGHDIVYDQLNSNPLHCVINYNPVETDVFWDALKKQKLEKLRMQNVASTKKGV